VSGAALAGIPFSSGFLSKEALLTSLWMNPSDTSWAVFITMTGVSFLTVLYTFRLYWFVFMGEEQKTSTLSIAEAPMIMRAPMILLALCSLWLSVSWNPFNFTGWLMPSELHDDFIWITIFSILWIGTALAVSYAIFRSRRPRSNELLRNGFFLDVIYQRSFGRLLHVSAKAVMFVDKKFIDGIIHQGAYAQVTLAYVTGWFDRAILDGFVNALAWLAQQVGSLARSFQGGKIQVYIFWSVFALIIFLLLALN
jgi:NADH-quinone oxidoreductase subunit L